MNITKKFSLLSNKGLKYYEDLAALESAETDNNISHYVNAVSNFMSKDNNSFEERYDVKNVNNRVNSVLTIYDRDLNYEQGSLVLEGDYIFKKLSNERDSELSLSNDVLNWEKYIDLRQSSGMNPNLIYIGDPSLDHYENISVIENSNVRNKVIVRLVNPPVTREDGSRFKVMLSDGSYATDQNIFLDAHHDGFSSFTYKQSRAINGGIEMHYAVNLGAIDEDIAYLTIGLDLENFDVDSLVFKTNNGHTIKSPMKKDVIFIRKGTVLEEGKLYSIDEETPFGNDSVTSYYNASFNYGQETNREYNYLNEPIGIWKALEGSGGIEVGDDVKDIGLEAFGGLFPPRILSMKAGMTLEKHRFYKFEQGVSDVGGANITNWLNSSRTSFGNNYEGVLYKALIDFKIPEDTRDILKIPNIDYIIAPHDNENLGIPPYSKKIEPGVSVSTGEYIMYSDITPIGRHTGNLEDVYGINYKSLIFVWDGNDFTFPEVFDARNYYRDLSGLSGEPPVMYIAELNAGGWVSKGTYYIITENTQFGDFNGSSYIGKIYKAEQSGPMKMSNYQTVLGTTISFTPSIHHGNNTPFPSE